MELIVVYFMECLLEFIGIESMFFFSFSFFLRYVKLFVKFPIIISSFGGNLNLYIATKTFSFSI